MSRLDNPPSPNADLIPAPSASHHLSASSCLGAPSTSASGRTTHSPRSIPTSPILVHPLPSSSALQQESLAHSEQEYHRQIAQRQRERELAEALQEQQWEIERASTRDEMGSWAQRLGSTRSLRSGKGQQEGSASAAFQRPPQAYELYQAIDKKDIDFIMRVRDHAFGLLLQKNAGQFPILYAARIGPGHRDVVILLIGAMSRFVNQLEEEDYGKKETRDTLKALRSNLKLAIDNALLPGDSPHLLSSYLQVLIMSEGDAWLHKAVYEVSLLLRDPNSHPVQAAEDMVRGFCTKELRGVQGGVADVEEYIANAALDLIIMATWSLAAGQIDVELLPVGRLVTHEPGLVVIDFLNNLTYTFARDFRTWTMLSEAMDENHDKLRKVSGRVGKMLKSLRELGGDSKKGVRGRLRDVREAIDSD